jgi:5-azacytidine-induced protein 1
VQAQVRQLQEQMAVEKEVWQENYRKKQDALLMQKERELQQQVKSDRDKDIGNVMQQLLKENQAAIDECEREAEKRIKCVLRLCILLSWRVLYVCRCI